MTGSEGDSEFRNVFRDEVVGNIEIRGKQNSLFPSLSDLLDSKTKQKEILKSL